MEGCLFPLGQLSTFAEKYSTWDFYERNSTKTQETICPLNPKYDVIFCVRVKLQGDLCGKAKEIISHIWEKGDNLSLRSTSHARKRVCLSSNTGLCVDIFSLTNKVEEHCAFPSLLEPYLRLLTIGVFSTRMVRVKISMFIQ